GQDREASLGVRLLMDAKTVFGDDEALSTKVLLHKLIELEESPWGELSGKPLNERGLAHRLRQYSIKSQQIRFGDVTLKGYRREDFIDAWKRYVPPPSQKSETSETAKHSSKNSNNINGNLVSDDVSDNSDVSDDVPPVSDDVSDTSPKNANTINNVSDVSLVSLLPCHGGQRHSGRQTGACAQCRGTIDGTERLHTVNQHEVWLHPECRPFWTEGDGWGVRR